MSESGISWRSKALTGTYACPSGATGAVNMLALEVADVEIDSPAARQQTRLHSTLPAHPPTALNVPLSLGGRDLGSMGLPALRSLEQGQGRGRQPGLLMSPWPPGGSEPQRQWGWHRSREVRGAQGRLRTRAAGGQLNPNAPAAKPGLGQCLPHLLIHEDGSRLGATRQLTQPRSATSKVRTSPEPSPEVQEEPAPGGRY